MNSVVTIEKIANGYIVTLPHQKDETFFDNWEKMISYIKFCFDLKEEAGGR